MTPHIQPCACPVPLSHLLRMMDSPPDFTPPKFAVCRPNACNSDAFDAEQRKRKVERNAEIRTRYIDSLSKTKWRSVKEVAELMGVTPTAAGRILIRDYLAPLVERKQVTRDGVTMGVWRRK